MRHKTNLHFYPVRVNAHFRHVRRMQNDYLPPKAIHHSACKPGPDHQKRSGHSQLAQAIRTRIAISRVFGGPARCSQSSPAMQDVSTKCCCTKDARVVSRFGTASGRSRKIHRRTWATEDATDMLRVTFTVLGYLEKGGSRWISK